MLPAAMDDPDLYVVQERRRRRDKRNEGDESWYTMNGLNIAMAEEEMARATARKVVPLHPRAVPWPPPLLSRPGAERLARHWAECDPGTEVRLYRVTPGMPVPACSDDDDPQAVPVPAR